MKKSYRSILNIALGSAIGFMASGALYGCTDEEPNQVVETQQETQEELLFLLLLENHPLETKVGFHYVATDDATHTDYSYSVENNDLGTREILTIEQGEYPRTVSRGSLIHLTDYNNDRIPDSYSVVDFTAGRHFVYFGEEILAGNVTDAQVQPYIERYSSAMQEFVDANNIDERLENYEGQLVIGLPR